MSTQFGFQMSSMKLGKKRKESMPHLGSRVGFTAGGNSSSPMSGASHGPNKPLRRCRSIGFTMFRSLGGAMPPHDETMPCGGSITYAIAS